ncbi:hypothetical protein COCOR_03380 [Corallococcus coralloides DSM 2259]|uniref:Uncharacterized protein n=1 Tax=Corallococcus coralloides (strain ATCC 25202 / DSM 2259 / NBRC 100086 / M2) TaxID=1144275 RepID=H8MJ65_CORCM|nr:hypothetical protein [Corallococcus coralloides]AFE05191.1 hypothetical protein COCOR_03380 [Corallococcus coralloides DSM 2259]
MALESPALRAVILGCALLSSSCSDTSEPPRPPPPVEPWDGTYTPLVDPTDWVDRGEYAPCAFTPPPGTVVDCDDPSLFDLSKCDTAPLATLEPHGIYQVDMRHASGLADFAGIRVPADGGTATMNSLPTMRSAPITRQQLQGGFRVSAQYTFRNTVRNLVFAGCGVTGPGLVTGCFARCTDGKVTTSGTFEAARMTWARGESESSGGLRLLSETHVQTVRPVDVYVHRGHAYVVSIDDPLTQAPGGLAVVDVRDPSHPVITKRLTLPGDSYWNAAWAKDDALYIASKSSGVIVFDITDPADPAFVRSVPGRGPIDVHTMFVEGHRLYAVSPGPAPTGETLVFDISTPLEPVLLNRFTAADTTSMFPSAHDSFAYQDRLYVNHFSAGYVVYDVKDPMSPQELGHYTFETDNSYATSHASAVGTFAGKTVAFEGGEYQGAHLRVLDVTDPTNIQLMGRYKLRPQTSIHNMILKGQRLYIAYYQEGLRVLDVSVPPQPREVAYFNTFRESDLHRGDDLLEGAIGIRVPGDGHVYVVDTARGLLIFNEL